MSAKKHVKDPLKNQKITVTAEKDELEAEFGDDGYYPAHLRETTLEQRVFAYFCVRSENGAEAVRKASLFRDGGYKNVYQSAYVLKNTPVVQELIQHEKKKLLQEIRIKTVRFSDDAVEALRSVLSAKSAVARVQAALALLNVAGVAEDTKSQEILEEKPLQLLPHDKRMEIIRASADTFADDRKNQNQ
jgi:hypothetical protein